MLDYARLAEQVLAVAKAADDLFDPVKGPNHAVNISVAALRIMGRNGQHTQGSRLVVLILQHTWNDSIKWAEETVRERKARGMPPIIAAFGQPRG